MKKNLLEESIMEQPIWDVRCWLQGLNEGEYLNVIKEGRVYTNADEVFREVVAYGEYERSIEDEDTLNVIYKNGDIIKLEGVCMNTLNQVKADNERIEKHSNMNQAYNLLNQLYNAVPESYRDKISYGTDYEDNGEEKSHETIFFDDIALGTIDDINYIGCWNGNISMCGRWKNNEKSEFDKFIKVNKINSYRNIYFTYKRDGEYNCKMTPELKSGMIHKRDEIKMITV